MRYRVPKIDMNTPKGRFANAYRLYRTALNNRDAQEYLIEFIRVVFGERYLNACEDGYRYNDYDPEWFDTFQSDYHKRVKEWRMTPEELEAERKRIRSYTEFGGHNATFVIKDSISLSFDGFQTWTSSGPPPKMPERDKPSPGFDDFFSALWGVKPPPPKDE